jgi:hypothetical protein
MPPKKETPNLISTRLLHKQAIAWLWKTMDILRTKSANVLISSLQKSSKGITDFKNCWDKITYKWEKVCFATTWKKLLRNTWQETEKNSTNWHFEGHSYVSSCQKMPPLSGTLLTRNTHNQIWKKKKTPGLCIVPAVPKFFPSHTQ